MKNVFVLVFSFSLLNSDYYSQYQQDKILNEKVFKNKKNGIFVEIGAYDGILYSNTKFFEESLNWRGICVEPVVKHFKELEKNRPNAICVNACIANSEGRAPFFYINSDTFFVEMLSGLIEKYDPRHFERAKREIEEFGGESEVIEVDCIRLDHLLKLHQLYEIDYLCIDTEGGELEILKSIDFREFNIKVVEVENNYHTMEIREFMTNNGYLLFLDDSDEIYIKGVYASEGIN